MSSPAPPGSLQPPAQVELQEAAAAPAAAPPSPPPAQVVSQGAAAESYPSPPPGQIFGGVGARFLEVRQEPNPEADAPPSPSKRSPQQKMADDFEEAPGPNEGVGGQGFAGAAGQGFAGAAGQGPAGAAGQGPAGAAGQGGSASLRGELLSGDVGETTARLIYMVDSGPPSAVFQVPFSPSEIIDRYHNPSMVQRVDPRNCSAASAMLIGLITYQEFEYHSILDRFSYMASSIYWIKRLGLPLYGTSESFTLKQVPASNLERLIEDIGPGFATLIMVRTTRIGHSVVLTKNHRKTPILVDMQLPCYAIGIDRIRSYLIRLEKGEGSTLRDEVLQYDGADGPALLGKFSIEFYAKTTPIKPDAWLLTHHAYRTIVLRSGTSENSFSIAMFIKNKLEHIRGAMMDILFLANQQRPGTVPTPDQAYDYLRLTVLAISNVGDPTASVTQAEINHYKEEAVLLLHQTINDYLITERKLRPITSQGFVEDGLLSLTLMQVVKASKDSWDNRLRRVSTLSEPRYQAEIAAAIAAAATRIRPPAGGGRSTYRHPPSGPKQKVLRPSFSKHRPSTRRQLV